VADIVAGCSDAFVKPKPPWAERRQKYVAGLPGKSADVRLVSAADKLANVWSAIQDYRTAGEALGGRFNAPRNDQLWYCRALADAFTAHGPASLARELDVPHHARAPSARRALGLQGRISSALPSANPLKELALRKTRDDSVGATSRGHSGDSKQKGPPDDIERPQVNLRLR